MGIPREEYDDDIHAYCGRCGVIMLIEYMECPVEGDGLYCDVCSEQIRYERMSQLEFDRVRNEISLKRNVEWFRKQGMSLSELTNKVSELYNVN